MRWSTFLAIAGVHLGPGRRRTSLIKPLVPDRERERTLSTTQPHRHYTTLYRHNILCKFGLFTLPCLPSVTVIGKVLKNNKGIHEKMKIISGSFCVQYKSWYVMYRFLFLSLSFIFLLLYVQNWKNIYIKNICANMSISGLSLQPQR